MSRKSPFHYAGLAAALAVYLATSALAHDQSKHSGGIQAEKGNAELAPFDVIHAKISTDGNTAVFHMAVSGRAGKGKPTPVGTVAGSDVFA